MTTLAFASIFSLLLADCSPGVVAQRLPSEAADRLQRAGDDPDSLGELIYAGRVQARNAGDDVLFRYERRVEPTDDGWVGSHLTFDPDGAPLVLHVAENWDSLIAGEAHHPRFLVMDAGRTYRCALRFESSNDDTTIFKMTAANALVRLAVPTMRISFDTVSRTPTRFEGLVPPMSGPDDDLRKLNATVDYVMVSDVYR